MLTIADRWGRGVQTLPIWLIYFVNSPFQCRSVRCIALHHTELQCRAVQVPGVHLNRVECSEVNCRAGLYYDFNCFRAASHGN